MTEAERVAVQIRELERLAQSIDDMADQVSREAHRHLIAAETLRDQLRDMPGGREIERDL